MGHARQIPSRILRTLLASLFVLTLLGSWLPPGLAQEISPTADAQVNSEEPLLDSSPTEIPAPAVDTDVPTDVPGVAPTETATAAADFEIVLDATETSSALDPAPTGSSAPSATIPAPTSSPTASATATSQFGVAAPPGVNITIKLNDTFGPVIPDICVTIREGGAFNYPQEYGCTDANGRVRLRPTAEFQGSRLFLVSAESTNEFLAPAERVLGLVWGTDIDIELFMTPQPTGTETLRAVDGVTGNPIGNACWSYFANVLGSPGDLKYGPTCDDDGDGTIVVSGIARGAYCLIATAPAGYQIVGADPICTVSADRNFTFTKAFVTSQSGTTGSLSVSAHTAWNTTLENVCPRVVTVLNGQNVDLGGGCTDVAGNLTISGLFPGTFNLVNGTVPGGFEIVPTTPFTILAGTTTPLDITVPAGSAGNIEATSVFGYGPQTLPGTCWTYQTAVNLQPTGTIVIGPVCDTDGDGLTILTDVPRGVFCVVIASPPPGYVRNGEQFVCLNNMAGGKLTVGFSQPVLPTATITRTPTPSGPTNTPTATATAIVTPAPAGDEPNTGLTVKNCYQSYEGYSDSFPGQRHYQLCESAPAGVVLAVFQNGFQVGTVTTEAGGVGVVTLTNREPYQLRYLSGNGSTWTSAAGEEAKLRYDSRLTFYFEPAPSVDRTWTLTIGVKFFDVWNGNGYIPGGPVGGACFRIVGKDGNEYLANTCDTDNDGVIVMGQLPPRLDDSGSNFYRSEMTTAPTGYELRPSSQTGYVSISAPNQWVSNYIYRQQSMVIRTEDPDGNLVPGFCFRLGARVYVNDGTVYQDQIDCDYQGITRLAIAPQSMGNDLKLRVTSSAPGYLPDESFRNIMVSPSDTVVYVTIVVRQYGTTEPDQASVRLQLRDHGGNANPDNTNGVYCATLSPAAGIPSGSVCESEKIGDIVIRNLDPGTYTASFTENRPYCNGRGPLQFTITEADLGGEKIVPVEIDCGYQPDCHAFRDRPGRTVDFYIGDLFDTDGTLLTSELQISESLPLILTEQMLLKGVPEPGRINASTLAPWTESLGEGGSAPSWDKRPDYDGNAHQRLLTAFGAYGTINPGTVSNLGTFSRISSVSTEFTYYPTPEELRNYPECAADTSSLFVSFFYSATLNFYQLDARIAVPPTATVTATPSFTAIPTQEPVCDTIVTRNLTAYYGSLKDADGTLVLNALSLSDRIPLALRNAIRNAQSPGEVRSLISDWVDRGLLPEDWAFGSSDGLDPAADLLAQYRNAATEVTLDEPGDRETITYEYTSYRLYDEYELPDGCAAPVRNNDQGFSDASLGRLIPVLQTTRVQVSYYELNAVAGGTIQPTTTPTVTTTAEPSVSPVATETPEQAEPTESGTPAATETTSAEPTETAIAAATDEPDPSSTPAEGDDDVTVTQLPNTGAPVGGSGSVPGAIETMVMLLFALAGLILTLRNRQKARA